MSLIARLIEAGTPADLIEEVAMMIAEKRTSERAIEESRAKARARQARKRDRESRDITASHVTDCDIEKNVLSLPPNENNSNPPTHTHPDNTPARKGKSETPAKPDGVNDQTWRDFLDLRKRKRAPLTQTAMDGIKREVTRAGWSLEAALCESVTRGWQAFKADWVTDKPPKNGAPSSDHFDYYLSKQTSDFSQ